MLLKKAKSIILFPFIFAYNYCNKESIDGEQGVEWQDENLFRILSEQLKVKSELLLKSRGYKMHRLCHKAFAVLKAKYGLSTAQVARMHKVSAIAVVKVLKKHNEKV